MLDQTHWVELTVGFALAKRMVIRVFGGGGAPSDRLRTVTARRKRPSSPSQCRADGPAAAVETIAKFLLDHKCFVIWRKSLKGPDCQSSSAISRFCALPPIEG